MNEASLITALWWVPLPISSVSSRAEIRTESGGDSLVVPESSLVLFAGIEKVVTVKDGRALERPVTTGRRAGDQVEVLSGLEDGEPVVVKPGNLTTGAAVEIERSTAEAR